MGASSLASTKKRINSIASTKKITSAMKLVATSKLKSVKSKAGNSDNYLNEIGVILGNAISNLNDESESRFFAKQTKSKKKAIFIITSSLGLCGGYNYNVFKKALSIINNDAGEYEIFVIGNKARNFFKSTNHLINEKYIDLLHGFDYGVARKLSIEIEEMYLKGVYESISFVYTKYINSLVFVAENKILFPFGKIEDQAKPLNVIMEPNANEIVDSLVPLYVRTSIYEMLNQSLLSEYSSRRNAMENATDNAEDLVNELQIKYNKERQSVITQEITEVVSGANALK